MLRTGLIILAAGGSSRLGTPKQLLMLHGSTLIHRTASAAVNSMCRPIIVVIGSSAEAVRNEVASLTVDYIENKDWRSGIGSSIRMGLQQLLQIQPQSEGVCIALCDQPFFSSKIIDELLHIQQQTGCLIAASDYGDGPCVPALFHSSLFPKLLELPDSAGAKSIFNQFADRTEILAFPQGELDIDTPADWENVLNVFPDKS